MGNSLKKKYYISLPSTHQLFHFAEILRMHKIPRNLIPALPGMSSSCSTVIEIRSAYLEKINSLITPEFKSSVKIFSLPQQPKINLKWLEKYTLPLNIKKSLYNLAKGKFLNSEEISYFIKNKNSLMLPMVVFIADEIKDLWLGKKVEVWKLIRKTKRMMTFLQGQEKIDSLFYKTKDNFSSLILKKDWSIKDILAARKRKVNLIIFELKNINFPDLLYLVAIWRISLPNVFLAVPEQFGNQAEIVKLKRFLSSGANLVIIRPQKKDRLSDRQIGNVIQSIGKEVPDYLLRRVR